MINAAVIHRITLYGAEKRKPGDVPSGAKHCHVAGIFVAQPRYRQYHIP